MKPHSKVKFKLDCGHGITMDTRTARKTRRRKFRCHRCLTDQKVAA